MLLSKLLAWVFGVFFALCFTGLMLLWWENTELQKDVLRSENTITVLTNQRDALEESNRNLTSALTTQNKALEKLGLLQQSVDGMFSTFNTQFIATNKQIGSIKDRVASETTPTTCKDTIQYLKDARKEIK